MNHQRIQENIHQYITLNETELLVFLSRLKKIQIPGKRTILCQGQLCEKIYFVESGALRAFYIDESGKEVTIMFAIKDWWITDMYSFINEKPAMLTIETIENSMVYQLKKNDIDYLNVAIPQFEKFFRILMQNAHVREQLRVIHNLSLSAEARYEIFLNKYPDFAEKVKQKQIASYLGITPELLSMIKQNKGKGLK
ncbi:Crp/Fnr family transcriptional regulator [Sphingobacterium sp. DR205]|uniref:Crp/Fnr family transcriptional regulator n=1 Tax=Sphingobacterium sp. DR205 TaxID=2713573 RepID=UPI0013E4F993|nr:Crp/Fnr family transcriptional regulator [Sphingobacterium sp. DR205]QIH34547.1 Crp/Fnr family transcriptional regulator [Sphingobacterium sp. DR205]